MNSTRREQAETSYALACDALNSTDFDETDANSFLEVIMYATLSIAESLLEERQRMNSISILPPTVIPGGQAVGQP